MFSSNAIFVYGIRRDRFQDFRKVLFLSMKLNSPQRTLDIAWGLHFNISLDMTPDLDLFSFKDFTVNEFFLFKNII